jgi:membrane protein DedA with SNARE-associated domain
MEHLIERYGALAVILGAATEGDVTMILAGVVVHIGLLRPATALVSGWLGAVLSDAGYFAVGRHGAPRIRRTRTYQRVAPFVERLARRLGPAQLVVARIVYGTRIASLVFWGVHGLGWSRFLMFAAVGAALWAGTFFTLGFMLSDQATLLIGRVKLIERRLLIALVVATGIVLFLRALTRRRLAHEATDPPAERPRPEPPAA